MGKWKTNKELMDKGCGKARDVLSEKGHSDTEKLLATIVLYLDKIDDPFEENPIESDVARCKDMLDEMLSAAHDIKESISDRTGDDYDQDSVPEVDKNIKEVHDTLRSIRYSVEDIRDRLIPADDDDE